MGERYSKPVALYKALKRADISDHKAGKAVERLNTGSSAVSQAPKTGVLISLAVMKIHNIRLSDLLLTGTKYPYLERHSRFICLMMLYLLVHGKASRTAMLMSFNFTTPKNRLMLTGLVDAGYMNNVTGVSYGRLAGTVICKNEEHLQLSAKGYDLANHIIELLTDPRLI